MSEDLQEALSDFERHEGLPLSVDKKSRWELVDFLDLNQPRLDLDLDPEATIPYYLHKEVRVTGERKLPFKDLRPTIFPGTKLTKKGKIEPRRGKVAPEADHVERVLVLLHGPESKQWYLQGPHV